MLFPQRFVIYHPVRMIYHNTTMTNKTSKLTKYLNLPNLLLYSYSIHQNQSFMFGNEKMNQKKKKEKKCILRSSSYAEPRKGWFWSFKTILITTFHFVSYNISIKQIWNTWTFMKWKLTLISSIEDEFD